MFGDDDVVCVLQIDGNDDCSATLRTSCLTVTVTAGTTYAIQLDGFNGSVGDLVFTIV